MSSETCSLAGEFKGALQAISSISKAEGVKGLFAGYGSFLLRDLPFDAIEFVAYEQLKRSYKASLTEDRDPNSLETSAIGRIPLLCAMKLACLPSANNDQNFVQSAMAYQLQSHGFMRLLHRLIRP